MPTVLEEPPVTGRRVHLHRDFYPDERQAAYADTIQDHRDRRILRTDVIWVQGSFYHRTDPAIVALRSSFYGQNAYGLRANCQELMDGSFALPQDVVMVGGQPRVSGDNCYRCHGCDAWHDNSVPNITLNNQTICATHPSLQDCQECGERCLSSPCPECIADNDPNSNPIGRHNWRAASNYRPETTDEFCLGIELEVEVPDAAHNPADRAREVLKRFPKRYVALKTDGSLRRGFEIVSRPDSLAVHKKHWEKFFERRISGVYSEDEDRCGMHVHMSRAPLSTTTIGMMLVFLNENTTRDFIRLIAGRAPNNYCEISKKEMGDVEHLSQGSRAIRYTALNLLNPNTVEVRIFQGTLIREDFMKNIEFCHCLKHWAEQAEVKDAGSVKSFVAFARRFAKRYPYLVEFLRKHKVCA